MVAMPNKYPGRCRFNSCSGQYAFLSFMRRVSSCKGYSLSAVFIFEMLAWLSKKKLPSIVHSIKNNNTHLIRSYNKSTYNLNFQLTHH